MEVDWQSLLNSIRIPWVDRGRNVSRGNINIKCCWCPDDPSEHLSIALGREAYYCWRNPKHAGTHFTALLVRLGQTRAEATRLLNDHRVGSSAPHQVKVADDPGKFVNAWGRFSSAAADARMIDYLAGRGFPSPRVLCELYDLRYAREGKWANRLLIPLYHQGKFITWTGRDITGRSELRYMMNVVEGFNPIYAPDRRKLHPQTLILVEGPLGALRISCMTQDEPWACVALCGKGLGPGKLLDIRRASHGVRNAIVALDPDAPMSTVYQIIHELAGVIKARYIGRARLPGNVTGPDELELEGIKPWVRESLSRMQRNDGLSERAYG